MGERSPISGSSQRTNDATSANVKAAATFWLVFAPEYECVGSDATGHLPVDAL